MIKRVFFVALLFLIAQCCEAQFFGGGRWQVGTTAARPSACRVGDVYFSTDATPGSNLSGCTSTNTWTQLGGSGGGASWERQIIAAKCQGTIAGAGFSLPAANAPTPNCSLVQVTNTPAYATLDWDDTGTKIAYDTLLLPGTLGTIAVQFAVSTNGTSTAVQTLRIQTACITSGGTADPAYTNAAQSVNVTPDATIGDPVTVTLASLTLTGCSASQQMRFRLDRDTADANTNTLRLHWVKFYAN